MKARYSNCTMREKLFNLCARFDSWLKACWRGILALTLFMLGLFSVDWWSGKYDCMAARVPDVKTCQMHIVQHEYVFLTVWIVFISAMSQAPDVLNSVTPKLRAFLKRVRF